MLRFIGPCLLTCLALVAPSAAWAQVGGAIGTGTGGTTGSAGLSSSDFTFYFESYDPVRKAWVQMNATQQQYFFNRARCECDSDVTNYSGSVKIAIQPAAGTAQKILALLETNLTDGQGAGRLYVGINGVDCLDVGNFISSPSYSCTNLLDPGNYGASFPMALFVTQSVYESPPIPVAWLYNSLLAPACGTSGTCDATSACATTSGSQIIWFWAQTNASLYPDRDDLAVTLDLVGQVPHAPTDVTAAGDNESLMVSWSWPAGNDPSHETSFLGVQVFCQRGDDGQVFKTGLFGPSFMTAASLCPDLAPATSPSGALGNLDPRYLCSGLLPPSATGHVITGLQSGVSYSVGVAAVDKFGNVSELSNIAYATPTATTTLGGNGGCSFAPAGRHQRPGTFATLLGIGLLATRLRRRRPQAR